MSNKPPINNEDTAFLNADYASFILADDAPLLIRGHYFAKKATVYGDGTEGCMATELTFETNQGGRSKQIVISKQGRCAPLMTPEASIRTSMSISNPIRSITEYRDTDLLDIWDEQRRIFNQPFHKMCYFVPGVEQEMMTLRLKRAARERYNIFAGVRDGQFRSTDFGETLADNMDEFQQQTDAIDPYVMVDRELFPEGVWVNLDGGRQHGGFPDDISIRKQILTHMLIQGNHYPNAHVFQFTKQDGEPFVPCPVTRMIPRFQNYNLRSGEYVRWHNGAIQQMDILIRGLLQASEQLQEQRNADYREAKALRDREIDGLVEAYSVRIGESLTCHARLRDEHGSLVNLHLALVEEQRMGIMNIQAEYIKQTTHFAIDCIQHRVLIAQRLMWCRAVRKWLVLDDPSVSPDARPVLRTENAKSALKPGALEPGSAFHVEPDGALSFYTCASPSITPSLPH